MLHGDRALSQATPEWVWRGGQGMGMRERSLYTRIPDRPAMPDVTFLVLEHFFVRYGAALLSPMH